MTEEAKNEAPATEPGSGPATKPAAQPAAIANDGGKLQGWAIVENQTDSDWENVQLSLVSGRPISFIEDLYQPLFVTRPTVEPELYASLRPQRYGEAMDAVRAEMQAKKPMQQALQMNANRRKAMEEMARLMAR